MIYAAVLSMIFSRGILFGESTRDSLRRLQLEISPAVPFRDFPGYPIGFFFGIPSGILSLFKFLQEILLILLPDVSS